MKHDFVGYCNRISIASGEPLGVHVAGREPHQECWVDIYRITGCLDNSDRPSLEFVLRTGPVNVAQYALDSDFSNLGPGDADMFGCGWPEACALTAIPESWPSGPYLAQFTRDPQPSHKASDLIGQDALFIVRRPPSRPSSAILVQLGVGTWNAYHLWQNRNLYVGYIADPTGDQAAHLRAHRVSFHRPGIGLAPRTKIAVFPPTGYMYTLPFVQWAREEGIAVDYCAGTDIDQDLVNLKDYRLLVTLGHDEYWSGRQRDRVEAYIAQGGNAAFFGGNMCYWQIRVTESGQAIECYKRTADPDERMGARGLPLDPLYRDPRLYPGHDNSNVTVEFNAPPVNRLTTSLTGVSMYNEEIIHGDRENGISCGAAWWWENYGGPERPALGFTIVRSEHWAFEGTGLQKGESFGKEQKLIGFECDGLDVTFDDDVPHPSFRDGAPNNLELLAYADCRDWAETDYAKVPPEHTPGRMVNNATLGGVVTMISWESAGGGQVFTAPVTDWPRALVDLVDYTAAAKGTHRINPASPHARTITANVLRRLSSR